MDGWMVHGQDICFPLGSCSLANLPIAEGSKSLPGVSKIGDDRTLTWKNGGDNSWVLGHISPLTLITLHFVENKKIVKENINSFGIFKNVLIFNMKNSKLINYLTDLLCKDSLISHNIFRFSTQVPNNYFTFQNPLRQ
jgi:hypothetical protein